MANGSGTDESVMAGIDWVINKKREIGGNWIINLSLGANMPSDPERDIFARAIAEGILVVAAAGNNGTRGLEYPAAYDRVVAVSAIDADSKLASFSSFGDGTVFAGPGVNVLSTFRTGVIKSAEIDAGATVVDSALPLLGSALGEVTADTVYCGIGKPEQFPADAKGKIALITRGTLYFREKVRNAIAAGSSAPAAATGKAWGAPPAMISTGLKASMSVIPGGFCAPAGAASSMRAMRERRSIRRV